MKNLLLFAVTAVIMISCAQCNTLERISPSNPRLIQKFIPEQAKCYWDGIMPIHKISAVSPNEEKTAVEVIAAVLLIFTASLMSAFRKRRDDDGRLVIIAPVVISMLAFVLTLLPLGMFALVSLPILLLSCMFHYMCDCCKEKNISVKFMFANSILTFGAISTLSTSWKPGTFLFIAEGIIFFTVLYFPKFTKR